MRSYADPAKRLSREKFYEFILKHLIIDAGIKPKDIKIVCLETPEALEIKEVYDRLGIPRANITVIERDIKVAAQIEAANLGVKVVSCWDYEYFEATEDGPFHIISLDYKGKKNKQKIKTIGIITSRGLLFCNSILLINTFSAREKDEKEFLAVTAKYNSYLSSTSTEDLDLSQDSIGGLIVKAMDNIKFSEIELQEARNLFTMQIIYSLATGIYAINQLAPNSFCFAYPYHDLIQEKILEELQVQGFDLSKTSMTFMAHLAHLERMKNYLINEFGLAEASSDQEKNFDEVFKCLYSLFRKAYFVHQIERYKYISSNGAPMDLDLFMIHNYNGLIEKIKPVISYVNKSYGFFLKVNKVKLHKRHKQFIHDVFTIHRDLKSGLIKKPEDFPERIFLGSSSKMLKEQNKQDASE